MMNCYHHIEATAECITTKTRAKCRVPLESIAVREKQDNMKKESLLNKRNSTNTITQKLKPREK